MKKPQQSMVACTMASLFGAMLVFVQSTQAQTSPSTSQSSRTTSQTEAMGHHRASQIIDSDVENPRGESLGEIEDLVFDERGEILYAVLSYGGFLGLGDKYFAVPWSALTSKAEDDDTYVLNIDEERLKNAPGFDKNNWPDTANSRWGSEIYSYYGQSAAWQEREARNQQRMGSSSAPNTTSSTTSQMNADEYFVIPTIIVGKVDSPQSNSGRQTQSGSQSSQQRTTTSARVEDLQGRVTLRTTEGSTMEFAVSQQLLESLNEGDRVEVVLKKANGSSSSSGTSPSSSGTQQNPSR